jgi:N-acylneuraminate cytidylyltransferase
MEKIKRLLIIPARLNSRRVKNKNIKIFFKKPIIAYPIKTALKSKLFSKIHVSTESKKILRICKNYGIEADCLRPKNYLQARQICFPFLNL